MWKRTLDGLHRRIICHYVMCTSYWVTVLSFIKNTSMHSGDRWENVSKIAYLATCGVAVTLTFWPHNLISSLLHWTCKFDEIPHSRFIRYVHHRCMHMYRPKIECLRHQYNSAYGVSRWPEEVGSSVSCVPCCYNYCWMMKLRHHTAVLLCHFCCRCRCGWGV